MTTSRELPNEPDFARKVEQCEVDAWLRLDQSAPGARKLEAFTVDGATVLLDRSTDWPHSRILNLGVHKAATAATLEKILTKAREAGVATLETEVSPIARPGTLSRLLVQAGFSQMDRNVVVARQTRGMPEPDGYFRIREASQEDFEGMVDLMDEVMPNSRDWCILLSSQVSRPDWCYYLAMEDGVMCALSGLHLRDEVAWLSPIWVRTPYRNRGTQAALIAHSVRAAEAQGAQWIVSNYPASVPGRTRNFERAGFSIVYLRNRFVWNEQDVT